MISPILDEDSDSDQEEQEKKRKRRRKSSDRQAVLKEKWLKKHPLSIQLSVNCAGKPEGSQRYYNFYENKEKTGFGMKTSFQKNKLLLYTSYAFVTVFVLPHFRRKFATTDVLLPDGFAYCYRECSS